MPGLLDVLHDAADDHGAGRVGDGVDVELERVLEELVDQDRVLRRGVDRLRHVAIERRHVVDDRHAAAAEHVRRAHDDREADPWRHLARFFARRRGAARRLRDLEIRQQRGEALAVLGEVDRVGRRAENPDAGLLQAERQLERRLAAELHQARRRRRRPVRSFSMTAITSSNVSGWKYSRSAVS